MCENTVRIWRVRKPKSSPGLARPLNEIQEQLGSLEGIWGRQNNMDTSQCDTIQYITDKSSALLHSHQKSNVKSFTEAEMTPERFPREAC